MNCRKCGNILHESSTSCPFCGEIVARRKNDKENIPQTPKNPPEVLEENFKPPMMPPNNNKIEQYDTNPPRKKHSLFSFILTLLLIAILGTCCFIGYKYIKEEHTKDNSTNINENDENNETPVDTDENNNETENNDDDNKEPDIEKKPKYFEISGYKFTISNDLEYNLNTENNTLILSDKNNNFRTAISFDVGDYESYDFDPEQTIKDLEESGYTITSNSTKTIDELEYYLYEGIYEESPILAFTYKLDNNIILIGAIVSNDTISFEKVLEYITEIIKTAEETKNTIQENNESSNESNPTEPQPSEIAAATASELSMN